jgi:drug/metabolite transporter (DMT)-like permease
MTAALPVALRGALWMVGALVSFSIMAISVRELLHTMGAFEILFLRSFMSLVLLLFLLPRRFAALRTRHFGLHVLRNAFHFGQYARVFAISILPLATVFAIEFTMPVWAASRWCSSASAEPGQGRHARLRCRGRSRDARRRRDQPAALVMLLGAFAYASTMIATKRLSGHDSAFAILFYMAVIQLPFALIPALPHWVWPAPRDLPWVIALGVVGLSAHYCMTRAFRIADAMVVVPIDFLRLPLIAVVGMLLYGEPLELPIMLGAVVIFAGTIYSLRRESMGRLEPSPRS